MVRNAATNASQSADTSDFFRFELLQTQAYFFSLSDFGDGSPPAIEVLNADGQVTPLLPQSGGQGVFGLLHAGSYVLHLSSWDSTSASAVTYQVDFELGGLFENPTPLTSGAAPAVGIRLAGHGPPPVFVPPVVVEISQSQAAIPSGLLVGLNAPAMGAQGFTTPAFTPDTALVRLFGFSSRDQLFSLIDSTLPRSPETPEVTQAELTADELLDLLNQNGQASDETTAETLDSDDATETSTDEEPLADRPNAPANDPRSISQPTGGRKKNPAPVTRNRPARPAQIEFQSSIEKQPAAFSAPIAFALATSLAGTLRERARREKESTKRNPKFQIPMSKE